MTSRLGFLRSVVGLAAAVAFVAVLRYGSLAPAAPATDKPDFLYFAQKVLPVMRSTCAGPKCHGGAGHGFQLQAVDPKADVQQMRADYRTVLKYVQLGKPGESPLVLKPLSPRDGGLPHAGREVFRRDSAGYRTLAGWAQGRSVGNVAPVADAGKDRSVRVGTLVRLDASASRDLNGDRLSHFWRVLERPPESRATLTDSRTAKPTLTPDAAGPYIVELVVTDGDLRSQADRITIDATSAETSIIVLEPESQPLEAPLVNRVDPDARGGRYVTADRAIANAGRVVLPFEVTRAGTYVLWARVQTPADRQAFLAILDDRIPTPWQVRAVDAWTLQRAVRGTDPPKAGQPERPAWRVVGGKWALADGGYRGAPDPDADAPMAMSVLELPSAADRLDVTAKPADGAEAYLVFGFRAAGDSHHAGIDTKLGRCVIGPGPPPAVRGLRLEAGQKSPLRLRLQLRHLDADHRLLQLYVNGQLKVERLHRGALAGGVGLMCRGGEVLFDSFQARAGMKVIVADAFPPPVSAAGRPGDAIRWILKPGKHRLTLSVLKGGVKLDQVQLRRLPPEPTP